MYTYPIREIRRVANGGGALVLKLRLDLGFGIATDVRVRLTPPRQAVRARIVAPGTERVVWAWADAHSPAVRTEKASRASVAAGDGWHGVVFCERCGARLSDMLFAPTPPRAVPAACAPEAR